MKKILIIISVLAFLWTEYLIAQETSEVFCTGKNYVFDAKKVDGLGIVFTVTNINQGKKDTVLISQAFHSAKSCFCNDTLVAFYLNSNPSSVIRTFRITDGAWKYASTIPLPPTFPLVGVLIDGKKYEKYKHTMVSIDKVVSQLTILQADNAKSQLVPLEEYEIEYSIDYNTTSLLIEKKTVKE